MSNEETRQSVALVTGGSRGIGAACSIALARAEMDVIVHYRRDVDRAAAIRERVASSGRRSITLKADLGRVAEIQELYRAIDQHFGRLDVVVNNAAVLMRVSNPAQITEAIWDETMAVNAKGTFFSSLEAAKRLTKNPADSTGIRGRIINIGSVGGMLATGHSPHYGASKAAVHSLSRSLAEWLAPDILVNAVAPGFVDTEMIAGLTTIRPQTEAQTPLRRWAAPEEIAEVVTFLATSGRFITGQTLTVDGGIGNVYAWVPRNRE